MAFLDSLKSISQRVGGAIESVRDVASGGAKKILKNIPISIGPVGKPLASTNALNILKKIFPSRETLDTMNDDEVHGMGLIRLPDGGYMDILGIGSSGAVKNVQRQVVTKAATALDRLITSIKSAGPVSERVAALQSVERGVRAAKGAAVLARETGETAFQKTLGTLKGELVPEGKLPKFEALKLTQNDVDELANIIKDSSLRFYEKVTAYDGLKQIFSGKIPVASTLDVMEDVFGPTLIEALKSAPKGWGERIGAFAGEALNLPRTLMTSMDMSAPLRQGIVFTVAAPERAGGAFKEMFRQVFSPDNFKQWFANLRSSPEWGLIKDAKLYIADPTRASSTMTQREEAFLSQWAERLPLIGKLVRASERAYVSYLNKLRVDNFTYLARDLMRQGYSWENAPEMFRGLAQFVNSATGRGNLGRAEIIAPYLNGTFFSPRLMKARVDLLNPVYYARLPAPVRKMAMKTMLRFTGTLLAVVSLAKMAGADVEDDMTSSDFGKIKIGDTRFEVSGGFQPWLRVLAQVITGRRKSTTTGKVTDLTEGKFGQATRRSVIEDFFYGKLAPIPALIKSILTGKTATYEPLDAGDIAANNLLPMYLRDIYDAAHELGPIGAALSGVAAFFGVGAQTYEEKKKRLPKL